MLCSVPRKQNALVAAPLVLGLLLAGAAFGAPPVHQGNATSLLLKAHKNYAQARRVQPAAEKTAPSATTLPSGLPVLTATPAGAAQARVQQPKSNKASSRIQNKHARIQDYAGIIGDTGSQAQVRNQGSSRLRTGRYSDLLSQSGIIGDTGSQAQVRNQGSSRLRTGRYSDLLRQSGIIGDTGGQAQVRNQGSSQIRAGRYGDLLRQSGIIGDTGGQTDVVPKIFERRDGTRLPFERIGDLADVLRDRTGDPAEVDDGVLAESDDDDNRATRVGDFPFRRDWQDIFDRIRDRDGDSPSDEPESGDSSDSDPGDADSEDSGSADADPEDAGPSDDGADHDGSDAHHHDHHGRHGEDWQDLVFGVLDMIGGGRRPHHDPFPMWNWGTDVYVPGPGYVPSGPQYVPIDPVVPANTLPIDEAGAKAIVLLNPEGTPGVVRFLLDGHEGSLEPTQYLEQSTIAPMIIEFDRGGDFGLARYSLSEGIYVFKLTERGWDVARRTFTVTLDNSANADAFHYLADGEPVFVPAGLAQTHQSRFPVVIAFDRGDGGEPAQVALPSGTYAIATNPQTGLWDLVPVPEPDQVAAGAQM